MPDTTTALTIVKKNFTDREKKLLVELTKPGAEVSVVVPADAKYEDWLLATSVICRAYKRAELQEQSSLSVLGRLLLYVKEAPQMLIDAGFKGYDDFIEQHIEPNFGVSRSTCYFATDVVERYSALLPDAPSFEAISRRNFLVLKAAIPKADAVEKKGYVKKLLEMAASISEKDLREHCIKKGYIEQGEDQGAFLKIPCNKAQMKRIEKFLDTPAYQAYCGTPNRAAMIEKAIAEATPTWDQTIEGKAAEEPVEEMA